MILRAHNNKANKDLKLEEVRVNMADMKTESKPCELLHRCGGVAHVMLPKSAIGSHEPLPAKFADIAVLALAAEIRRLTAKIAGCANI